ncbi:diguanylate cyclase domain-containing protein [Kineococcus sp. SYSU DK004]|uniref:diguanylate cyclase domain-containing protein n=1 Tax=Kineococcus sp. SYSU DK004 TaxID=3383125 RepID=UPI003D7E4BFF
MRGAPARPAAVRAALLAVPVLVLTACWASLAAAPPPVATAVLGPLEALVAAAAAVLAGRARATAGMDPGERRSWRALQVACALWAAGQVLFAADELLGREAFPAAGDWFFVPAVCVLLASPVLAIPERGLARWRLLLDGALCAASCFVVGWVAFWSELAAVRAVDPLALTLSLVYPAVDVTFVVVVALTVLRLRSLPGSLVLAGGVLLTVADTAFLVHSAAGSAATGGVQDLLWLLAFSCFALAGWTRRCVRPGPPRTYRPARSLWALPYLALLPALVAGVHHTWGDVDKVAVGVLTGVAVTALTRQFLVLRDNQRLLAVTESQRAELHRLAHVDHLTGLATRALFTGALEEAVARAREDGGAVTLAFLDLDGFKQVNDTAGHAAGDEVLRLVAARLSAAVPEGGLAARWGGDEFAVLAPPGPAAAGLGGTLEAAFAEPVRLGVSALAVGASVGVVRCAPSPQQDPRVVVDDLLAAADRRMYAAKADRRSLQPTAGGARDELPPGGAGHHEHGRHRDEPPGELVPAARERHDPQDDRRRL